MMAPPDEHFIPGSSRITEIESFHRYHAAASLCSNCRVLDAASGEGYGAAILAASAAHVTGIDRNETVIQEAAAKYPLENLAFVAGDVTELPFQEGVFDRIISFETIEHLEDQRKFLSELRRVLKPEGILILSSPNKTPFRARNTQENPYHINELEQTTLLELLREYFPNLTVCAQDAFYNSVISAQGDSFYFVRDMENRVLEQKNLSAFQYTIVLASAAELPVFPSSSFVDAVFHPEKGYIWEDESVPHQFGLRSAFTRQQQFISFLEQTNKSLVEEKDMYAAEKQRLKENVEELQLEKFKLADKNTTLTARLGEWEQTVEKLKQDNKHLVEENTRDSRIIESMQQEHSRLASEISSLQQQKQQQSLSVEKLKQDNAALQQEKNDLSRNCAEKTAALEALENRHQLLQDDCQKQRQENSTLSEVIECMQKDHSRLASEISSLQQQKQQQSLSVEKLKQDNAALQQEKNDLSRACTGQSEKIKDLEKQCLLLREEKAKDDTEKLRLSDIIRNVEQINRRLSDENQTQRLENSELKQMIAQVKNMNQQLSEKLTAASEESAVRTRCAAELQQQLAELRQTLESRSAALEEQQSQYQLLAAEKEQLQAQLAELNCRWEEEHAKSEYLWHEWQETKKSLAYRLIGKFKLRRRALHFLGDAVKNFCRLLWRGGAKIPMSYSRRESLRDSLFSRFGFFLDRTDSFQEWQKHSELRKKFSPKGDTGLIMPREIPLTSIVIPVYNNLTWTKRCINSIYNIKSRSPFEIIVVDDCSTEDYTLLLKDFPGVRLLHNEENLGFLRTVNYGVSEAKGEYVLILNNDTEVLPNWLDELTSALYNHPEAGMIGSQLIHLNTGTLQESGNLICKNGDMMPLGRGADPDHPQFTYFREVDFCSAASIILRKKVFDEMDGFDRLYIPAYFEDPDLGLRLQKSGYKNYVCPLSRVIHQEMASYGDVLAEKCEKNRKAFLERWSSYLQSHALYADRYEPVQCMKFDRERVMFIDAETPMADRGSGGMDSIFFMEYMIKRGMHVVFHGEYTPGYDPKYTAILLRMGVECIYQPQHKIWEYLATTGWSFTYLFVCRIYQARCFDRLLKQYCPQASYIFDTVDVHFVRETLEAELKNDDTLRKNAAATKEYELAAAAAADAAIVISSDEKKLLEKEYHLTNVFHIPQARELFGLAPNPNRRGAVFIGSAHPPNLDGLRYFHDEILPLLPKDFKLTIIGESLKVMIGKSEEFKDLLKCSQFNFAGFVQDLGTELDHAKITIAPLRYGAGTKGKVASSMAYGVPCVSSGFGTEGTGMLHGENIMIAQTPQEFAQYIMQLFSDEELWQKISDGSVKFIKDNYAPETVEKMMDDLFDQVRKRRKLGLSKWANTPVMPKVDEV